MSPRGQNPVYTMPRELLEAVTVDLEGRSYVARLAGGKVVVDGGRTGTSWAWGEEGDRVSIRVGDRVPAMLSEWVDRSEHNRVVAGGVLIAALSGHPCEEEPGGRISFVWTDHVAIAAGLSLNVAFEHSHVKRP